MAKFKKGDRVRCVIPGRYSKHFFDVGDAATVIETFPHCEDIFSIKGGRLMHNAHWELADDTIPETVTVNGVEYIRKPSAPHSRVWEFGDVASHKEHGVGIVTSWASSQYAIEITTRSSN